MNELIIVMLGSSVFAAFVTQFFNWAQNKKIIL